MWARARMVDNEGWGAYRSQGAVMANGVDDAAGSAEWFLHKAIVVAVAVGPLPPHPHTPLDAPPHPP